MGLDTAEHAARVARAVEEVRDEGLALEAVVVDVANIHGEGRADDLAVLVGCLVHLLCAKKKTSSPQPAYRGKGQHAESAVAHVFLLFSSSALVLLSAVLNNTR